MHCCVHFLYKLINVGVGTPVLEANVSLIADLKNLFLIVLPLGNVFS